MMRIENVCVFTVEGPMTVSQVRNYPSLLKPCGRNKDLTTSISGATETTRLRHGRCSLEPPHSCSEAASILPVTVVSISCIPMHVIANHVNQAFPIFSCALEGQGTRLCTLIPYIVYTWSVPSRSIYGHRPIGRLHHTPRTTLSWQGSSANTSANAS